MADMRRRDLASRLDHPHPHPLPPPHPHAQAGLPNAVPHQQHPHAHPPHAMQHPHAPQLIPHHHAAQHIPRDRAHERPKPPQPLHTSNPGGRSGSSTKNLRCAFPGCGKLFTRKDHLIRHAANHSQPNFHCGTCGRSFQRLDLLQRHERRRICDDERYPKRMRTSAAPPKPRLIPTTGPVDHASTSSSDSRGPSSSMPPPNRPSPRSVQPHHATSLPHSGSSSHAGHSHHSGAESVASSFMGGFDSSGDTFPAVHDLVLSGSGTSTSPGLLHQLPASTGGLAQNATGGVANPSGGFDMGAPPPIMSGPIFLEPQQADFGFGLSTPDPWESLLQDTMAPAFWNESTAVPGQSSSFDFDSLIQPGSARPLESAERGAVGSGSGGGCGSGGGGPGLGSGGSGGGSGDFLDVGDALLGRIHASYPDFGLTVPDFTEALDLYWNRVAPSFPFIHRGTFDVDTAAVELVVMMAVTGAVHSSSRPRRYDGHLVRTLRANLIRGQRGTDMPLSTLQAYTLCHVYDTWYGDTGTLFVAQCLWPVVVAHSRKVGIGASGSSSPEGQGAGGWIAWAKVEERRRAAYAILFIDTQISTFWSQHPSRQLSIFAHNINLPCPPEQWEAATAQDWILARQVGPTGSDPHRSSRRPHTGQGFLPGLHPEFPASFVAEGYSSAVLSAIATHGAPPPTKVDMSNTLAVSLVLTGLTAIAWDCRARGGMGLRFRDGSKHWRTIVLDAVVNLRAQHEVATAHLPPSIERTDLRDSLAISIISILSDILMLQVAAGATNVCGASIGPKQYADSRRRLKLWAPTQDAWTCLWQSSRYLREALVADWGLYTPWAVFLTTLVVWAYASAPLDDHQVLRHPSAEHSSGSATALLDGIFRSPTRVDRLDAGVKDLVVIAARRLDAFGQPIDRIHSQLLWQLASDTSSTTAPPPSSSTSSSVLPPAPGWRTNFTRPTTSIFPSTSQQRST